MIYLGTMAETESTGNRQRSYFMKELANGQNRTQMN